MILDTPVWLRKPRHKQEVIATDKGWVVKETGEVLVRVRNLPTLLANHFGVPVTLGDVQATPEAVVEADPVVVAEATETQAAEVVKVDLPPDPTLAALGAEQLPVTVVATPTADPVVPAEPPKERKKPGPKPGQRAAKEAAKKALAAAQSEGATEDKPAEKSTESEVDNLLNSLDE